MNKKSNSAERPIISDSLNLRKDLFAFLYLMERNNSLHKDKIEFKDIKLENNKFRDIRTLKLALSDIMDFCHSGITLNNHGIEIPKYSYYHEHKWENKKEKFDIANTLSVLVENNDHPWATFFSAGSTAKISFVELQKKGLNKVVVTNNKAIIDSLKGDENSSVIFTGGEFKFQINASVGSGALTGFGLARCDTSIVGISGINREGNVFIRFYEEIQVLRQIIKNTNKRIYLVASQDKISKEDTFNFINLDQLLQDREKLEVYLVTNKPSESKPKPKSKSKSESKSPTQAEINTTIKALKEMNVNVVTCVEDAYDICKK